MSEAINRYHFSSWYPVLCISGCCIGMEVVFGVGWVLLWTLLTPVISLFCDLLWTCCSEELPTALSENKPAQVAWPLRFTRIITSVESRPLSSPNGVRLEPLSVIELWLRYLRSASQTRWGSAGLSWDAWNLKHHSFRTISLSSESNKSQRAAGRELHHYLCVCLPLHLQKTAPRPLIFFTFL